MGVSPSFYFMCGVIVPVDGMKKPLFDYEVRKELLGDEEWLGDLRAPVIIEEGFDLLTDMPADKVPEKFIYDVFREGNPGGNYGPYVVGYVIDETHQEMAYAMMIFFESLFETDEEFLVVPQLDKEKCSHQYRWHSSGFPGKEATDLAIAEGRWIEYYDAWYTERWFKRALALLHFTGWTGVTRDMLKIVLVKEWS